MTYRLIQCLTATLIISILIIHHHSLFGQQPELVLPTGHTKIIKKIRFSADGRLVFSISEDRTSKLWHAASGKQLRTFSGHTQVIWGGDISPQGQYGLTASWDSQLILWDLNTGKIAKRYSPDLGTIGHTNAINDAAFHPDGQNYFSSGRDGIFQWKLGSNGYITQFTSEYSSAIQASPDGKYLASVKGTEIRLWDIDKRSLVRNLGKHGPGKQSPIGEHICDEGCHGHKSAIYQLAFSPDSRYLISGGQDKVVLLWEVNTGKIVRTFGEHDHPAFATYSGMKNCVESCQAHQETIRDLHFTPDGQYVVSTDLYRIIIWEVATGRMVRAYKFDFLIGSFDVHPSGRYLVIGTGGAVKFFDLKTEKIIRDEPAYKDGQSSIALSPDETKVITGRTYNSAKHWELATGKKIHYFQSEHDEEYCQCKGKVRTISFSPDGRHVMLGGESKGFTLWDIEEGKRLKRQASGSVVSGAFSPDGRLVATTDWSFFQVWDIFNRDQSTFKWEMRRFERLPVVKFNQAGNLAYAPSNYRVIKVYDVKNGKELSSLGSHKAHLDMGKKMDKSNSRAGRCVEKCAGHTGEARAIDISKNGQWLVSGGEDKLILWDLANGKIIWEKDQGQERHYINQLAFINNDTEILGRVWENDVRKYRIWSAKTGRLMRELKSPVDPMGFVLTSDEQFLLTPNNRINLKEDKLINQRLYFEDPEDFMFITPDNYYYASKAATRQLHFVIGQEPYSFDQFDLVYNRPDIVLDRMGLAPKKLIEAYKAAYVKRLTKMDLGYEKIKQLVEGNVAATLAAPEVYLLEQGINLESGSKRYSFSLKAVDPRGNALDRLYVKVNGVPIDGIKGRKLNHTSLDTLQYRLDNLILSNGANLIEVSVMNSEGISSLTRQLEVDYTGSPATSNLHVVTIGVSDYQDSEMNLRYAAKDARDLSALLSSRNNGYGNVYIHQFLNQSATKENILSVKQKLLSTRVDDEVVVFVAGHGLLDDNLDYYIATHDVDFNAPSQRGLLYDDLEGLLDGIPARKKLMLIDACHSGEVDKEETTWVAGNSNSSGNVKFRGFKNRRPMSIGLTNSFELMQELFNDLRTSTGTTVISAASGVEFSFEGPEWNNGVFTYSLLEGMKTRNADANKDGEVNVSELKQYVMERVVDLTDGAQNPTSRKENLGMDFSIWK